MHRRNRERETAKEVASRVWLVECQDTKLAPRTCTSPSNPSVTKKQCEYAKKNGHSCVRKIVAYTKVAENERPGDEPGDVLKSW